MGLRINTNIEALNSHKNLTRTDGTLGKSLERLSSGLRINKAADDASGLAIADTLRAQHTGIGQAISNANDGVNIIQIADGALEESINIVNTIRTKAIQAASDGQNLTSRKAIQADVNKLLEELEMIGDTTAYNGISLLDGGFINKSFHVGAYKDQTVGLSIGDARGTKVGAMAYAVTKKDAEAAVSNPFVKGGAVTAETITAGDIRINGIQIGSAIDQNTVYYDTGEGSYEATNFGSSGSAFSKAAAINAKVNETGVAAKATTELVITVGAVMTGTTVNSIDLGAATNGTAAASIINNSSMAKSNGIRAELVTASQVRIIADDGRNLSMFGGTSVYVNGASMGGLNYVQRGTLTLSNARAMTNGNGYVKADTINTGDLTINGVDIAAGGPLTILKGDMDHTLVNVINNNKELQSLGIRAELYKNSGDTDEEFRLRLISDDAPITIGGNAPGKVASLVSGTTQGIKTTGIVVEGASVDSDLTADNYLRAIGFDGARFGTSELDGVSNSGGNDIAVASKAYLKTSQVTEETFSAGDIIINGVQIGAAIDQQTVFYSVAETTYFTTSYGRAESAFAKATAINAKTNETGVSAKATSELVIALGTEAVLTGTSINSINLAAGSTNVHVASIINNSSIAKSQGIRAELVGASHVRILAEDGRNLSMTVGAASVYVNGAVMSALSYTAHGTLSLTNSRAMTNGEGFVTAGVVNAGELIINGVDVAKGGSLTVLKGDTDRTLLNAINNNADLQKIGIRAELYKEAGDNTDEFRVRLISDREAITISGTDPNKVARMTAATTDGKVTTEMSITGALVDTDLSTDNFLRTIGLDGAVFGSSEPSGVNNTGGNDKLVFGQDRLNYNSGDVEVNGYKIGATSDDGISHAMGDKSAAALAAAINLVKTQTGVEADIIKATQTGAGAVKAGTLQQRDIVINGVDIVRANSDSGIGMDIQDGDADHTLMKAINEYKDQTGVIASINDDNKLVLTAVDGRNIHVQSTANGNKFAKFEADFGEGKGVAQDSVYMGNIRLVSDSSFTVDGNGSSNAAKEISLLKLGLAGGGASTEATSDLKGDGTFIAGVNYKTAIAKVDVTTQEGAEMAIRSADYALKRLDEIRSGLGSTQNQLTSTIANLSVTKINVQATESTIRDVDFAAESSTFSKMQVLMQAGTYAMSQANSTSQNVMRLLQ